MDVQRVEVRGDRVPRPTVATPIRDVQYVEAGPLAGRVRPKGRPVTPSTMPNRPPVPPTPSSLRAPSEPTDASQPPSTAEPPSPTTPEPVGTGTEVSEAVASSAPEASMATVPTVSASGRTRRKATAQPDEG